MCYLVSVGRGGLPPNFALNGDKMSLFRESNLEQDQRELERLNQIVTVTIKGVTLRDKAFRLLFNPIVRHYTETGSALEGLIAKDSWND